MQCRVLRFFDSNLPSSLVDEVTVENFQSEVLEAKLPVVIDFYAPWCAPCRQLAPLLDEMAEEYQGCIRFVKVNSDEQMELSNQYEITSLPTLVLMEHGSVVGQISGLPTAEQLRNEFAQWTEKSAAH